MPGEKGPSSTPSFRGRGREKGRGSVWGRLGPRSTTAPPPAETGLSASGGSPHSRSPVGGEGRFSERYRARSHARDSYGAISRRGESLPRARGVLGLSRAGLQGQSPPLPSSLFGRPPRVGNPEVSREGPPPGVVMFPSGNMLLTESGVSRNNPWCGSLKYASSPGSVNPSGIHIAGRFGFSQEQIDQLRQEFPWIRMKFPVRCKMPVSFSLLFSSLVNIVPQVCASLRGSLREVFQNTVLLPGVPLRRMACDTCGLKYLVFPWGGIFGDSVTIQALVLDQENPQDPYRLGIPAGYYSWRHCYSVLDSWLQMNEDWTKKVSGNDWQICRTMEVRVIAVKTLEEVGDVIPPLLGSYNDVLQGPAPVPNWLRRHGHSQTSINRLHHYASLNPLSSLRLPRDLGLDAHHDYLYEETGGLDQNAPPPGFTLADMFGYVAEPAMRSSSSSSSSDSEAEDDLEEDFVGSGYSPALTGPISPLDGEADNTMASLASLEISGPSNTMLTSTQNAADTTRGLEAAVDALMDMPGVISVCVRSEDSRGGSVQFRDNSERSGGSLETSCDMFATGNSENSRDWERFPSRSPSPARLPRTRTPSPTGSPALQPPPPPAIFQVPVQPPVLVNQPLMWADVPNIQQDPVSLSCT